MSFIWKFSYVQCKACITEFGLQRISHKSFSAYFMNFNWQNSQRSSKKTENSIWSVLLNDLFLSFICWLVFGPPMATVLSTEFSTEFFRIDIWVKFIHLRYQHYLFIAYFYFFGYYKSLIRYFDSRDSIFLCVSGSLLFGFSWAAIYILQFNIISTSFFIYNYSCRDYCFRAVLYAFINISTRCSSILFISCYKKMIMHLQ